MPCANVLCPVPVDAETLLPAEHFRMHFRTVDDRIEWLMFVYIMKCSRNSKHKSVHAHNLFSDAEYRNNRPHTAGENRSGCFCMSRHFLTTFRFCFSFFFQEHVPFSSSLYLRSSLFCVRFILVSVPPSLSLPSPLCPSPLCPFPSPLCPSRSVFSPFLSFHPFCLFTLSVFSPFLSFHLFCLSLLSFPVLLSCRFCLLYSIFLPLHLSLSSSLHHPIFPAAPPCFRLLDVRQYFWGSVTRCAEAICVTLLSSGPWLLGWSCVDAFVLVLLFVSCVKVQRRKFCVAIVFWHFVSQAQGNFKR